MHSLDATMRDDLIGAIVADMTQRAGEQAARRWAAALGLRQALADLDRRADVALAIRLFDAGADRSEVYQRLVVRGRSRATCNRRISEALAQGPRRSEPAGADSALIVNHSTAT